MAEKLLSSKTQAEKHKDLVAVSKATGVNYTERPLNTSGVNRGASAGIVKPSAPGVINFNPTPTSPTPSYTDRSKNGQTIPVQIDPGPTNLPYPGRDVTGENGAFFSDGPAEMSGRNYMKGTTTVPSSEPLSGGTGTNVSSPSNPSRSTAPALPQAKPPGAAQTLGGTPGTTQPTEPQYDLPQSQFREDALNEVGQEFFTGLGAHSDYLKEQIAQFEQQTGKQVAMNSRAFQSQIRHALGDQNRWDKIFQRFGHKPEFPTTIDPEESSALNNSRQLTTPIVDADQTIEDQMATLLNDQGTETLHSQLQQVMSLSPETPGETLLRNSLMLTLGAIEDPRMNQYLDSQEARALQSYKQGLALVEKGRGEIDAAIEGTLADPETSEGLLAKIYSQGREFQMESIRNQSDYENARHNLIINDLREKRADLEGYAKAKLYSMGAEDSSAGVALVGKIVSQADMQITLAELDHNYSQRQLNLSGRQILADYTNNVAKLVMDQKAQEETLAENFDTKLAEIDKSRLTNEVEKRKLTLQTMSQYMKDVNTLQEKQRSERMDQLKFSYDQAQDAVKNAIDISGLRGTVYVPDGNGGFRDTGVPTFEAQKFQTNDMRAMARLQIDVSREKRQIASTLIDNYGSGAAPYIESLLGLPQGALDGIDTRDELDRSLDYYKQANAMFKKKSQDGMDVNNGEILDKYHASGKSIVPAGIGIDPFSLPDVRENILGMSNITQKFSRPGSGMGTDGNGGHGGVDYVSKDGFSRALRGGTVVEVIPWNGNSAFGNVVRVQDETGLVWQYAHMGNRDVQGDYPFNVAVGSTVNAGDVLGREGNTGSIITSKKGNLRGRHTDVRIVAHLPMDGVGGPDKKETEKEKKARQEEEAMNKVHWEANWVAPMLPPKTQEVLQDTAFAQNKSYTVKELIDEYVAEYNELPTKRDKDLLKEYGLKGLRMIRERKGKKKPKKTEETLIE